VTDRGLVVGSQQVPLGVVGQVAQTVSQQGVTVKYVPAQRTPDSILSAGLEISAVEPVPNMGAAKQIITITLGRAYSQGDATAFGIGLFPVDVNIPGVPGLPGGTAVEPSLPSGPVAVTGPPAAVEGSSPVPPTVATSSGPASASAPRYVGSAAELPALSLYPILALGGVVLLGTTVAVRRQTRASI